MKALTICQPYAHLIVIGEKRVENREWPTRHRGRIAIHAGKSRSWLTPGNVELHAGRGDPMVFGAVVGTAELVDCLHIDAIEAGDCAAYPWLPEHPHASGTWCWILDRVERINPIPCSGAQGLWNFDDARLPPPASPISGTAASIDAILLEVLQAHGVASFCTLWDAVTERSPPRTDGYALIVGERLDDLAARGLISQGPGGVWLRQRPADPSSMPD